MCALLLYPETFWGYLPDAIGVRHASLIGQVEGRKGGEGEGRQREEIQKQLSGDSRIEKNWKP